MTNFALWDQEPLGDLCAIQLELMLFYNLGFSWIVVSSLKQGNKGAKYCQVENTVKSLRCHSRCCCCCCCWWFLPVIQSVPGGSLFKRRPGKSHQGVTNSSWFFKFSCWCKPWTQSEEANFMGGDWVLFLIDSESYFMFGKLKFMWTCLNFQQTIFSRPMIQQRLIMHSKCWKISVCSKQWSYLMKNFINLLYKGHFHDYQVLDYTSN